MKATIKPPQQTTMKTGMQRNYSSERIATTARANWVSLLLSAVCLLSLSGRAETVIWQESFDDGNGANRWYADYGVWQMGSPTVGPQTAYSTPNCATTGLNGNYLADQDSRLIRIASFSVPAADQLPCLRFWHWYSFAGSAYGDSGSYGYVEIKPAGGAWQQVSLTYSGATCGNWWRVSIDLAPYAGQTVQVAFHFHSAKATDAGWYVDDVSLVTTSAPQPLGLPEGFELGAGSWTNDYSGFNSPTWQIGVPLGGPGGTHSGTNCAATMLGGAYCAYSDSRLISPMFVVPASNNYPRLRFWHWFSFAASAYGDEGSYASVDIRAGTNDWQMLSQLYSGSSCGLWWRPSLDLMPYAGQTVQVAFHFHSARATAAGWYVDDLDLETGTAAPLNLPEGFEQGLGGWTTDSGANSPTWQVGVPSGGPGNAHSGTNCAAAMLNGTYCGDSDSRLISQPFLVPPCSSSPALRFWHWYSFAGPAYGDEGSYGYVEIKSGTNDWQVLSSPNYTGQSGIWSQTYFDLSAWCGQTCRLAFHFHSARATAAGWYVDDINILGNVTPPPTIVAQPGDQKSCLGHSATFTVSATGNGTLSYQWYFNTNTLLVNATNASLTLTNLQGTNAGKYSVVVSNSGGSTNSAMAQLTLFDPYTEIEVEWYFDAYLGAGLYVAGQPGATYVIKYAPDLRNANWATWTPLATNTLGSSGWWFFLDEESPFVPTRFYQVRRKP
jgi:hypothetical protein